MESTPCSHAHRLKNIITEPSVLAKHIKEQKQVFISYEDQFLD